jgi:predicted CXXCH cytochrome family protein
MLRRAERPDGRSRSKRRARWATRSKLWALLVAGCVFLLAAPVVDAQARKSKNNRENAATNTCLDCHSQQDPPFGINAEEFSSSIHAQKGLGCTSCHGGDSSSDDMAQAMGKAAGFKGHIGRAQVPALCGKCHSDAAYIRGFNPSLRTDQLSQYKTSVHGQRLAKGDTHVAVCTDCHTAHNIRPPNDPAASVYPTNVAKTCARCHANADYMKEYKIPTNQYALYTTSVHYDALMVQGDVSAPTCSTCHGSHGAAPPGVASVENVCSTCHVFQQQLFDSGPHKSAFAAMNVAACIACHTNHGIQQPTDAMIGTGKGAICVTCHSDGEPGYAAAATMHADLVKLNDEIGRSEEILSRAEKAGVEVGEAKLALTEAKDDLTKARVTIHSVRPAAVNLNVQAGLKVTQKTYQAGLAAMQESKNRRMGLAVALLAIVLVLIALALFIRRMEAGKSK